MLKKITFLLFFVCVTNIIFAQTQNISVAKIWQTDTILPVPESVLPYHKIKRLFVSNINGAANAKDGNGSIAIVKYDGTISNLNWINGLNAPKGMAIYKNSLWVADIDEMVEIHITKAAIIKKIKIPNAIFLNDVTVDKKGNVYVSDTRDKKIYKITNDSVQLYINNLQAPNGLLWYKNNLMVLDNGNLLQYNHNNEVTTLASGMEKSTDGIVAVKNGFIVSCWIGTIYYINQEGVKTKILDTQEQKSNTADIGYNPITQTLYVPTFLKNHVAAYKLIFK
jgi:hypothetical protein